MFGTFLEPGDSPFERLVVDRMPVPSELDEHKLFLFTLHGANL